MLKINKKNNSDKKPLKETKVLLWINKVWHNKFFGNVWVRLGLLAILLNLIVEMLSRHSILKGFSHMFGNPVVFLYNSLMIFFTLSIVAFFKRRIFVGVIVSAVWLTLGITNFELLTYRKTPFTAPDLINFTEGMRVIPKYMSPVQIVFLIVGIVLAIGLIVLIAFVSPKAKGKINYLLSGLITALSFGGLMLFTRIGTATGLLGVNFGNIAQAYQKYGFGYCFTNSVFNSGINKPKDYSKDKVNDLVGEVETSIQDIIESNAEIDPEKDEYPNIIFVQLESQFDPTLVEGLKFSKDPIPNLRKLYKEYSSGNLLVPSFGAGTANTEFEVITGMNLDDFGPGEYPYKTVLKDSACESICYYLEKYNYSTNALHNNQGNFYQRNMVFSRLGFETFTSIEYIENYEKTPNGWQTDDCLIGEINSILDSTINRQDFIYTITVQGHGDYPEDTSEYDFEITVEDNDVTGNPNGFEYYVNEVYNMDKFVKELIDSLSKRDEKTLVVFYGDHLPTFDIEDDDLSNGDIYKTQYLIWDNFGLEKNDMDLQAYQLSSVILSRLGIEGGVISNYHLACMNEEDQDLYLSNLRLLEYDLLYGDCEAYGGELPYSITNLKMGHKDIRISGVKNISDHVVVYGQNFTGSSHVLINDEEVTTIFNDSGELIVDEYQVEDGDYIVVVQQTEGGTTLSSTSIYTYTE